MGVSGCFIAELSGVRFAGEIEKVRKRSRVPSKVDMYRPSQIQNKSAEPRRPGLAPEEWTQVNRYLSLGHC